MVIPQSFVSWQFLLIDLLVLLCRHITKKVMVFPIIKFNFDFFVIVIKWKPRKVFSKRKVKFGIIFTWLFAPALLMPFFFNNGFSWVGSVLISITAISYRYVDPVWLMSDSYYGPYDIRDICRVWTYVKLLSTCMYQVYIYQSSVSTHKHMVQQL